MPAGSRPMVVALVNTDAAAFIQALHPARLG
jgi:hypothetical protein